MVCLLESSSAPPSDNGILWSRIPWLGPCNSTGFIISFDRQITHKNLSRSKIRCLEQFKTNWIPKRGWSKRTAQEALYKIKKYGEIWHNKNTSDIDTFQVSEFLKTLAPSSAKKHIVLLDQFFRFCASQGYENQRPMLVIEKVKQPKRARARHTWEGHKAIYNSAPEWLQIAINTALYSLQRRADIVKINLKNDVNIENKTIRVLQQKTRNYDKPVFIDITMGDELYNTVLRSMRTDIACPFLIHVRQRQTTSSRQSKEHPFAVSPDYLTRAYSRARDNVGVYNHLPKNQRPGLHSLRALGIWLYTKAGHSDDYIMALSGHASEKMKAHYFEGHEKQGPVQVSAHLDISRVDLSSIDWETDLSEPLKKLADGDDDIL